METGPVDAVLSALGGAAFYRDNAYRLTGVPVTASPADIRRQHDEFRLLTELGLPVERPDDPAGCPDPEAGVVDRTFGSLQDPTLRLVHGLLWIWSPDGAAADDLTLEHDSVIRRHCAALTRSGSDGGPARPAGPDAEWPEVLASWAGLCDRPDLWDEVRDRAAAMGDPRVGAHTVARLRARLPVHVLGTVAELAATAARKGTDDAATYVQVIRRSPFTGDDTLAALEEQSDRTGATLEAAVTSAEAAGGDGGSAAEAAVALLGSARPSLSLLTTLLGVGHPKRTAWHDRIAEVVLRLCADHVRACGTSHESLVAVRSPLRQALGYATDHALRRHLREIVRAVDAVTRGTRAVGELPFGFSSAADGAPDHDLVAEDGPTAAEREAERRAEERRRWNERMAARQRRIEERRERRERLNGERQAADRGTPDPAAGRDREAAATAAADQERAREADDERLARLRRDQERATADRAPDEARPPDAPPPPRPDTGRPADRGPGTPNGGTAAGERERRLRDVRAMVERGSVQRAGRLLRLWRRRTTRPDDRDLIESILATPRALAHPASRVQAWTGAIAGCGIAVVDRNVGGVPGAGVLAVTAFSVPILPLRGVLTDGRGVQSVVPMPSSYEWAQRLISTGVAAGAAGTLAAFESTGAIVVLTVAVVVAGGAFYALCNWLRDSFWWRSLKSPD